jgi:hypothetical protein
LWGGQAEFGSTATAYQRVTDQYNVTEAGVSSVSYLFFDGVNDSLATPSINFPAGPTNPTLGAELVTNGDFAVDANWIKGGGWSIASGVATAVSGNNLTQSSILTANKYYRATITISSYTSGTLAVGTATGSLYVTVGSSTGTFSVFFMATDANFIVRGAGGFSGSIDNISVREIVAAQAPDKMTVFAGVRKLSDAAAGVVVEFSADRNANNGSWTLSALSQGYFFASKGTLDNGQVNLSTGYPPPITNVLTSIGNISADVATLRVNSTQVGTSSGDQGTGNYGNFPLYLGSRGGSSLFLSGHLYSLIVRGAQSNTGQISSTETWVAGKTGITI